MKNFQVRLPNYLHEELSKLADKREATMADLVRRALERYVEACTEGSLKGGQ